jgi:antirestriction protein ArdC
MNSSTQPRADVYTRVTAKIIADLEQGVRTWQRPWNAGHPNASTAGVCFFEGR